MNWRKLLVLAAVTAFVVLLGFGMSRKSDFIPSPLVGEVAPMFTLPVLAEDRTVSMADLAGQPVVVNFWASWCLACIEEHPVLNRAWKRYSAEGLQMLGVVYQDTPDNAVGYLEKYGGDWTQLVDPKSRAAIDFGVYGVPETFFIRRDGVITHKHLGPVTDALMAEKIGELLQTYASPDSLLPTSEDPAEEIES
jgi:cytochrome c biogenesis protein CcmG, thiol:disulfide interchange protein DsbE